MTIDYDSKLFPFMRQPQNHISENYVSIPPALVIQDNEGNLWTLGFDQGGWRTGEFEYDVIRNAKATGEYACRIEFRAGKVRIFGSGGWRIFNGNTFI